MSKPVLNQTYRAKQTGTIMTVEHIRRNGDVEMEFFSESSKKVETALVPAAEFEANFTYYS